MKHFDLTFLSWAKDFNQLAMSAAETRKILLKLAIFPIHIQQGGGILKFTCRLMAMARVVISPILFSHQKQNWPFLPGVVGYAGGLGRPLNCDLAYATIGGGSCIEQLITITHEAPSKVVKLIFF